MPSVVKVPSKSEEQPGRYQIIENRSTELNEGSSLIKATTLVER
jgi:hypothetical protein